MKPHKKLTPWQKIVNNYNKGHGLRLSWEELGRLNMDDAITTRADLDDRGLSDEEHPIPSDLPK